MHHRNDIDSFGAGRRGLLAATALAALLAACDGGVPAEPDPSLRAVGATPATHIQYGVPAKVGNGRARTYVMLEKGKPVEVGVALDETALEGLPTQGHGEGAHGNFLEYLLPMPAQNPTHIQFVELDWNPAGHEPPGIYDLPHFDFHFYGISIAERNAIDAADPAFLEKSANVPAPEYLPPGYVLPAPVAIPRMGVHWVDPLSPEINGATFTTTFLFGTWDGALIFWEPMITRAFLQSRPQFEQALPVPAQVAKPGYYPNRYRVTHDEQRREIRVALAGLAYRE